MILLRLSLRHYSVAHQNLCKIIKKSAIIRFANLFSAWPPRLPGRLLRQGDVPCADYGGQCDMAWRAACDFAGDFVASGFGRLRRYAYFCKWIQYVRCVCCVCCGVRTDVETQKRNCLWNHWARATYATCCEIISTARSRITSRHAAA